MSKRCGEHGARRDCRAYGCFFAFRFARGELCNETNATQHVRRPNSFSASFLEADPFNMPKLDFVVWHACMPVRSVIRVIDATLHRK